MQKVSSTLLEISGRSTLAANDVNWWSLGTMRVQTDPMGLLKSLLLKAWETVMRFTEIHPAIGMGQVSR